jgi:hypothetical protein
MYRRLLFGLSLLAMLSGCDYYEPAVKLSGSAAPTASASASTIPTARASESTAFTVDGIGPYQLGADFNQLRLQGRLSGLVTGSLTCGDQHMSARGTQPYQDITVSARTTDGRIYLVVSHSLTLSTASGAKVGSTLLQLKTIFGPAGEELAHQGIAGYLVRSPTGNGLLFEFDSASKAVVAILAGNAAYLKASFLFEADYC